MRHDFYIDTLYQTVCLVFIGYILLVLILSAMVV